MSTTGADLPNLDPEEVPNPNGRDESELFFADLRPLTDQEVAAQPDSLQAQYAGVQSRADFRSRLDAARLAKEIQHCRHEKTRRKPASERVSILK